MSDSDDELPWSEDDIQVRRARIEPGPGGVDDDRDVSPVIGVILMVAITVILAAVISTFVLDLGQSVQNTGPNVALSISADASTENVTIEHQNGESLDATRTKIIIRNESHSIAFEPASSSSQLRVGGVVEISTNGSAGVAVGAPWNGMTQDGSGDVRFGSGDDVTVIVIDTESETQIAKSTVTA